MRELLAQLRRPCVCAPLLAMCFLTATSAPSGAATYAPDRFAIADEPRLIVVAPDASLWILARPGYVESDNRFRLYRFDRKGKRRSLPVPLSRWRGGSYDAAIAVGGDGAIWVSISRATKAGRTALMRFSQSGRRLSTRYLPLSAKIRSMTAGPDGRMWMLGSSRKGFLKVSPEGRSTLVASTETAKSDFFVQGAGGEMWAVRRGAAVHFSARSARRSVELPSSGEGISVATRGADGAMWFNAAGRLVRIARDGTTTDVPLQFGSNTPPQTEQWVLPYRTPASIMLRADGRIGFASTFLTQDRESTQSGPVSIGAVEDSGAVSETTPGLPGLLLYYNEYYDDPTLGEAGFGQGRMLASPDGTFWLMNQNDEKPGAWRFKLDREVTLATGKPQFESVQVRGRSVSARMTCAGSPGKFCSGELSLQLGGGGAASQKQFAIAVGDTTVVRFRLSRSLDRGQTVRLVSRTYDAIEKTRTTVVTKRRVSG